MFIMMMMSMGLTLYREFFLINCLKEVEMKKV
jgi:hypothetical protein